MQYISTRGQSPAQSFCDILLGGLAPDGGLYLPEAYPQVSRAELDEWRALPYHALALAVLSKFITDIPACDLKTLVDRTYTAQTYRWCRPGRDASDITPLTTLEPGLHLLELSNGPTLAFKDMAMQLLGNLFEYALDKAGQELNILGATSGDTGSSAEYAMRGKHGVRVFMLSPLGKMSRFQTAQMFSLQDPNIFNLAVRGVFDDCQDIVKAVSNDHAFKARYRIGTVNSINWARVAAQVVYYFKGYFAATASNDEAVSFSVPSGNFGNVCAGHIARMMGLPIRRLIVATNENDVLDEFFRSGVYRPRATSDTHHTSSPSMDISKPPTSSASCSTWPAATLGRGGAPCGARWTRAGPSIVGHGAVRQGARLRLRVRRPAATPTGSPPSAPCSPSTGTMIDTHTADGMKVGLQYREAGVPLVVLETAQPAKFRRDHPRGPGPRTLASGRLRGLEDLPQRFEVVDAEAQQVKDLIARHCD